MSKMSKLSENLRELMRCTGISEATLARKSGVPQPTINRILSGNTQYPRGDTLRELANFFVVDINVLLGNSPMPSDRLPGAHNATSRTWEILPELSWELVPKWPQIKAELKKEGWQQWVSTDAPVSADAYALSAQGESMAPYFIAGTKLIIDPAYEPMDRDFVVICPKGQAKATLKQIFFDGDCAYLKPINPEFRMSEMTSQDRLLGVMVQARIDFRD